MSQSPVILYKDPNYASTSVSLKPGKYENIATATGMPKNAVSSVRVPVFTAVTLYSELIYGGNSIRIVGPAEIPDLRKYATGFNDKTASVIVEALPPNEKQLLSCCSAGALGDKTTIGDACGPYSPESAQCKSTIASYCAKNMSSPFCQSWCRNNTEICDAPVIAYCKKNPKDPYCSCINSKAGKIANPKCVDSKCITYGYLTTNMARTACPDLIDCSIKTKLLNSGVSLATVIPVEQNCGNGDSQGGTPASTTQTNNSPTLTLDSRLVLLLLLIAFVLIIIGGVAVSYIIGGQPANATSTNNV